MLSLLHKGQMVLYRPLWLVASLSSRSPSFSLPANLKAKLQATVSLGAALQIEPCAKLEWLS